MGGTTAISWCHSTFNTWSGCSPAVLGVWGPNGTRVARSESYMRQPLRWDREAARTGEPWRVFAHSDSDWCEQWDGRVSDHKGQAMTVSQLTGKRSWIGTNGDHRVWTERWSTLDDLRIDLFDLIRRTPHLTWLLLTKRPESVTATIERCALLGQRPDATNGMLNEWLSGIPPENVWLGTSVEDQATADERIPHLLEVPAKVHWVSVEPMLGPVNFLQHFTEVRQGRYEGRLRPGTRDDAWPSALHWIICGGESGPHARPFDLAWARATRDQCKAAGVPFYLKQIGAAAYDSVYQYSEVGSYRHKAGADPSEWPEDLRVREFPASAAAGAIA